MFFLRPYQQQADEMKDRPPEIELRQAILQSSARSIMVSYAMFFGHRVAVQMLYIYTGNGSKLPPYCWANSAPLVKLKCPSVTSYTYLVALGVPVAVNKSVFSMLNIGSSISDPVKAEHFGDELLQGVIELHKLPILGESNNTSCYTSMVI